MKSLEFYQLQKHTASYFSLVFRIFQSSPSFSATSLPWVRIKVLFHCWMAVILLSSFFSFTTMLDFQSHSQTTPSLPPVKICPSRMPSSPDMHRILSSCLLIRSFPPPFLHLMSQSLTSESDPQEAIILSSTSIRSLISSWCF